MKEIVIYKNRKYSVQTTGRYYQSYSKVAEERLLHRQVWFDNYGAIPKGYHVHHLDGNWRNNEISNLELIEAKKHSSEHMKERMQIPEYRANALKGLEKAIEKAKDWHKSEAGSNWHKEQGRASWKNRQQRYRDCPECGTTYRAYSREYCSNKCWQRAHKRMI